MTRIGILGASGRMGQAVALAAEGAAVTLAGGVDRAGADGRVPGLVGGRPIGTDPATLAAQSDVLVDFSAAAALPAYLEAGQTAGVPMLVGTTGLTPALHRAIDDAAATIAILQTGNTSLGVTLLARLVREAAARLGADWDVEIVEMHHRAKADAPSGTAQLLGQAAAAGRGAALTELAEEGRAGLDCARTDGAIGFASLRGGTVAGDHTVILAGEGERLELTHRAEDRAIFARGAVKAALWLARQPPGRYTMGDVLGL